MSTLPKTPVIIGCFGKVFGVKGWLSIISYTAPQENVFNFSPLFVEKNGSWQELHLEAHAKQAQRLIAKIKTVDNRELAKTYTNCKIAVDRTQFPPLNLGEYYWTDLEGLRVINQKNIDFGVVDHLFHVHANDVLVVKENTPNSRKERLIPFTKDAIVKVDMENKIIHVEWDKDF